jgi:hypothetical protein
MYSSTLALTSTLDGGERHALPPGKTQCPLYRRPDGLQGCPGRVRKTRPPPGFDSRTVQPVASRYYRLSYADLPVYLTTSGNGPWRVGKENT